MLALGSWVFSVDDYSRFTWTMFLASKQDAFDAFVVLAKKVQNERDLKIAAIRTDHGGDFEKSPCMLYSMKILYGKGPQKMMGY